MTVVDHVALVAQVLAVDTLGARGQRHHLGVSEIQICQTRHSRIVFEAQKKKLLYISLIPKLFFFHTFTATYKMKRQKIIIQHMFLNSNKCISQ